MDPIVQAAGLTAIPALIAAIAAIYAARSGKKVNDAVNHRHSNEPRLLDYVRSTNKIAHDNSVAHVHLLHAVNELDRKLAMHLEWHDDHPVLDPDELVDVVDLLEEHQHEQEQFPDES